MKHNVIFYISYNPEICVGPSDLAVWGIGLDRLDTEIVGSNLAYGMDVCLYLCK
jgi:hypothetical protein